MAKIWFATAEGDQKALRLDRTRVVRVGRDPGNDIVLRDARVSRVHAEILFERGFFVLHDLSSANGSFVNGRRVKVAPLTDGAEVRLGNTIGKFSEEVSPPDGPTSTEGYEMTRGPAAKGEPLETLPHDQAPLPDPIPPAAEPDLHETRPHPKADPGGGEGRGAEDNPPGDDSAVGESPPAGHDSAEQLFQLSRYWTDPAAGDSELRVIRDEADQPLFYFRRPMNLVGCFAALVAGAIAVAGTAALVVLAIQRRPLAAAADILLTAGFVVFVLMLVPRRHFVLSREPGLWPPIFQLVQESRFAFPCLRFSIRLPDGRFLAELERPAFSRLLRHRWNIRIGRTHAGTAVESSLGVALLQNFAGTFFGMLRTPFEIDYLGRRVGRIARPLTEHHHAVLDLSADRSKTLDRRIAIALAILVDAVEKQ